MALPTSPDQSTVMRVVIQAMVLRGASFKKLWVKEEKVKKNDAFKKLWVYLTWR